MVNKDKDILPKHIFSYGILHLRYLQSDRAKEPVLCLHVFPQLLCFDLVGSSLPASSLTHGL